MGDTAGAKGWIPSNHFRNATRGTPIVTASAPRVTIICHLIDAEEDVSSSECKRRFESGFIKSSSGVEIFGAWDKSWNQHYEYIDLYTVISIDGILTNNADLLSVINSLSVGEHFIKIYDPSTGSYEGWSAPLIFNIISD